MTIATRLCVIRHGETDWNATGILQGWTDVPLNDKGCAQARALADELACAGFTEVCTSPLRRCLETARIIADAWGLEGPLVYEGLKERHFGTYQGMAKAELAILHPDLYEEIVRRNPASHFDAGESMDQFADRILGALHEIARHGAGRSTLVITHGWAIDVITRAARGLPRTALLGTRPRNGEGLWLTPGTARPLVETSPPVFSRSLAW